MPEIGLEEATKDWHDNERDIAIMQHAIQGGWDHISNTHLILLQCLQMKKAIEKIIVDQGGEIPKGQDERTKPGPR